MVQGFIKFFCYRNRLSIPEAEGCRSSSFLLWFSGNLAEEKIGFGCSHGTAVNTVIIAEEVNIEFCFSLLFYMWFVGKIEVPEATKFRSKKVTLEG